jgi:hypothetical protein
MKIYIYRKLLLDSKYLEVIIGIAQVAFKRTHTVDGLQKHVVSSHVVAGNELTSTWKKQKHPRVFLSNTSIKVNNTIRTQESGQEI